MSDKRARANQYATAIIQAMLDRWQTSFGLVIELLGSDKQLASLLTDGTKSVDERASALSAKLPADTAPEILNLLRMLIQEGELDLIADVSVSLRQSATGQAAPLKAEITSAAELSQADADRIRKKLIEQHGEGLVFSFRVDPSLMGGLRVRVGDSLIDTSVATRLTSLRESLTSVVR